MPTQVIASCLGLIGFVVAVLAGLAADNPATTTLARALGAMFVCYLVGCALGAVATRALNEHIEQYKQNNPLPAEVSGDVTEPGDTVESTEDSAPLVGEPVDSVENVSPADVARQTSAPSRKDAAA